MHWLCNPSTYVGRTFLAVILFVIFVLGASVEFLWVGAGLRYFHRALFAQGCARGSTEDLSLSFAAGLGLLVSAAVLSQPALAEKASVSDHFPISTCNLGWILEQLSLGRRCSGTEYFNHKLLKFVSLTSDFYLDGGSRPFCIYGNTNLGRKSNRGWYSGLLTFFSKFGQSPSYHRLLCESTFTRCG